MSLLPCPFCGTIPDTDDGESGGTVECCNRHCSVQPSIFRDHEPSYDGLSIATQEWNTRWNAIAAMTEKDWTDILSCLSLGDVNDRPRFVAYDESYCLSRRDCAKMAQQLVRHFAPRQASNATSHQAGASPALVQTLDGPALGAK